MNIIKICITLCISINVATALATPPTLSQKYLNLKSNFSYLNTTANFDPQGGEIVDLSKNGYYRNYLLNFSAFYTFQSDAAIDLGFSFTSAESFDGTDERTNTEFTDVQGKILYQLFDKSFEIITEAAINIPFNRFDANTDDVLTGEGTMSVSGGLWLVKDFGSFYIYLSGFYLYRDEGRSHLLPWSLGTEFDFNGFYVGAEGYGFESVTDDEETSTPTNKTTITNRVNAGSLTYYAVNPQEIAAKVWFGIDFSKYFRTNLVYSQGLNGTNYGLNQIIAVSLEYKLDMSINEPKQRSYYERKKRRQLKSFEVDDESYDEDLFDTNKQMQRRKQKKKDEKLLNETEKSLESEL